MKKTIVINSFANGFTGYGRIIQEIILGLLQRDYKVKFRAFAVSEEFETPVDSKVRKCIVSGPQSEPLELVVYPPRFNLEFPQLCEKKQVLFTMWEADRLPRKYVDCCNKHVALIVPTKWNREIFIKSGVKVPIYVVPLGIDTNVFKPNLRRFPEECVFITAGRVAHGYHRKGINYAMEVFRKAFPEEADAKLRVKCFPDCDLKPNFDSRISIVRASISQESMVEFYQDSVAYLDTTTAEGFGLHQVEANACGQIVIGCPFSGKPIFNNNDNLAVKYSMQKVTDKETYLATGRWAKLDEEDLIAKMRYVYENREKTWLEGQLVREYALAFSLDNMITGLVDVLVKLNMLDA